MTLTTNKYRNKKIKNAYGTFDSKKEMCMEGLLSVNVLIGQTSVIGKTVS